MCYVDFLKHNDYPQKINKVTLIQPTEKIITLKTFLNLNLIQTHRGQRILDAFRWGNYSFFISVRQNKKIEKSIMGKDTMIMYNNQM